MGERFNATGRDCPLCWRRGSIAGDLTEGSPVRCRGCATRFAFVAASGGFPDTLVRIRKYRPADRVCRTCGRKHFGAFEECSRCSALQGRA